MSNLQAVNVGHLCQFCQIRLRSCLQFTDNFTNCFARCIVSKMITNFDKLCGELEKQELEVNLCLCYLLGYGSDIY